jgi:oligopeptide/dipeptide ABC transporter ATP-binding protein
MYLGRIVETGTTDQVFSDPMHPYTRALLSSVPPTRPWRPRAIERRKLEGEVPSPIDLPTGCGFRTRCWRATERCVRIDPQLSVPEVDTADAQAHQVACHHPEVEELGKRMNGSHV